MGSRPHRQIFAKVNAPVDKGIANLVSALSEFPTLCTLSSCEGGAFVTFRFGRTLAESSAFLCWLSRKLVRVNGAKLSAEWGGRTSVVFTLRCSPSAVQSAADAVRQAAMILDEQSCGSRCKVSGSSPRLLGRFPIRESCDELANLSALMLRDLRT